MSGVTIPAGSLVGLLIGAANRDPKAFPEPERLDLARKPRHAAFGFGPHFCIGAALARAEGEIAIETLFRRFPDLRLADAQPRWFKSVAFRGLESLAVIPR
jgi:cytochrome P450